MDEGNALKNDIEGLFERYDAGDVHKAFANQCRGPDGILEAVVNESGLNIVVEALVDKHSPDAVEKEFIFARDQYNNDYKKLVGRPNTFTDRKGPPRADVVCPVWLAIELEWYKKKLKGAQQAAESLARTNPYVVVGEGREIELTESARRYHTQAKQLMEQDPHLAEHWRRNLEAAKEAIDIRQRGRSSR